MIKHLKRSLLGEGEKPVLLLPEEDLLRGDKGRIGWVSPSYIRSRTVQLDPELMMKNRCIGYFSNMPEVEPYRVLRTQIFQRTLDQGGNTLMVTSPVSGEGKSLTAINLAFSIAKDFKQTVLLVDCDLRQQSIHKLLGITSEKGLVDYLLEDRPLGDIIIWPGVEKMTLISGGKTVLRSSELLGSPRMKALVAEMKNRYPDRYVIFDLPPVLSVADALTFAPLVDYVIMLVQAGKTSLPDIKRAIDMLPKEKILGVVLNRVIASTGTSPYYPKKEPWV